MGTSTCFGITASRELDAVFVGDLERGQFGECHAEEEEAELEFHFGRCDIECVSITGYRVAS